MKFARYLEETQTPEWKKAYIDYRGLKKRITAIRRAHQAVNVMRNEEGLIPLDENAVNLLRARRPSINSTGTNSSSTVSAGYNHHSDAEWTENRPINSNAAELKMTSVTLPPLNIPSLDLFSHRSQSEPGSLEDEGEGHPETSAIRQPSSGVSGAAPRLQRVRTNTVTNIFERAFQKANGTRVSVGHLQPRFDLRQNIPLIELLPQLTPIERSFFEKLDEELDKVESFYCERERDMRHRAHLLKEQLQELKDHRRAFHDAHSDAIAPYSWLPLPLHAPILPGILRQRKSRRSSNTVNQRPPLSKSGKSSRRSSRRNSAETAVPTLARSPPPKVQIIPVENRGEDDNGDGEPSAPIELENIANERPQPRWQNSMTKSMYALFTFRATPEEEERKKGSGSDTDANEAGHGEGVDFGKSVPTTPRRSMVDLRPKYDPEEYQHAKKQLKKAVVECYRGLELLNNFRTLNLIGFRKALKKFEKVTNIPAQVAYTTEKIEMSAFSSGATMDGLLHDLETLFAAQFARGDKKKAMARLRGGAKHTSHHFSTFRTGMALGLAVPAFAAGLYQSFRTETRTAIPGWDALLFIYGVLFVPMLFALIVGTNILVWARSRINYIFIFELDLRTRMDHRVYFEMPAFLLSLLCYAFYLSFARVGTTHVSPTTWPLLWLALVAILAFDPLPIMSKSSRWWILRNVGRLLTSGVHRVEFADFWMGDQFCSLIFSLSNLFFIVCVYVDGIGPDWRRCMPGQGPRWGIPFLLASLPLLARLVQSVKRWVDSGLVTHLINGGKYGSGILYYLFYYLWRAQGGARGPIFIVWCIFATNNSLYSGAWDLLMDWSLLRPHAPYPLLRPNLLYTNHISFYYVAMVSNTLIRFAWVFYVPVQGPNFFLRTFIVSLLEIFRRWQWNFLRLENEHLGNIDQYRVTREVPLPYSYDGGHESDGEDDEDSHGTPLSDNVSVRWGKGRSKEEPESSLSRGEAETGVVDE